MGLDVAEISEWAALRPIQTAVSGARPRKYRWRTMALPPRTPAASHRRRAARDRPRQKQPTILQPTPAASRPRQGDYMAMPPIAPLQQDDGVDVGFATPLATAGEIEPRAGLTAGDEGNFTTPTTADSALVPATVCLRAPRKSAPVPTRKRAPLQQRLFYPVPSDLTTVFVAMPQCPPLAKKIRAHAVESPSLPLGT